MNTKKPKSRKFLLTVPCRNHEEAIDCIHLTSLVAASSDSYTLEMHEHESCVPHVHFTITMKSPKTVEYIAKLFMVDSRCVSLLTQRGVI